MPFDEKPTKQRKAEIAVIVAATEAVDANYNWFECEKLRRSILDLQTELAKKDQPTSESELIDDVHINLKTSGLL